MTIVVTGASGDLGRRVTAELLARVPADDLVLVSRTPDALAAGVEARFGDFDDPAGLREAFRGGDRMLLISSVVTGPRRVEQHRAAIAAAESAGVEHIAYTSLVGRRGGEPGRGRGRPPRDRARAADARPDVTLLRHSWYGDVVAHGLAPMAVRTGRWTINTGEGQVAPIAKDDAAAAAAVVLTTDGHRGRTYDITGPELVTVGDLAAIASELTGRPVEHDDVDDDAMRDIFLAAGVDRPGDLVSFGRAIREGWFAVPTGDVEALTGRPGRTMRELLEASLA